jgi:hypothetical protein
MSVKKPAAVRILEGNPGRRPIEADGIEAQGSPFVPEHLPDDARGVIDVIKQSMPASVYSALDSFLLSAEAAKCEAAAQQVRRVDRTGPVIRPARSTDYRWSRRG